MVESGYYHRLYAKGLLKEDDIEPDVQPFKMYLDAFRELSSCRLNGMSLGPIPFTAIVEYSRLFDVGDFEDFHYCIRAMDNELLKLDSTKANPVKDPKKEK